MHTLHNIKSCNIPHASGDIQILTARKYECVTIEETVLK